MDKNFRVTIVVFTILLVQFNNFYVSVGKSIDTAKNPKIVIIGAGAAGIAAATKLFENGFTNVTLLEAEERIGGRVYTLKFGNYSVDLGGQWIHGQEGNVAYNLAKPLDLVDVASTLDVKKYKQNFFDSSGEKLNEEVSRKLSDFEANYVHEMEFDKNLGLESVGEYVEKEFDEQFQDTPSILSEKHKYLNNMELSRMSSDSAHSWYDVSAIEEGSYKVCAGDQIINWKERGYSTILDVLMKRYPNPDEELPVMNNTVLGTEVTSIDYLRNDEGAMILITTKNGQLYKADHVIVTVSLGVLKERHNTFFIPPLPNKKVEAIEGIGFGSVAKIYLLFDEPFWKTGQEKILGFSFIWNDEERKKIEEDPEKKWVLGILSAITVEHKPKLLTLWITGKCVKLMESISEDKIFRHTAENLHRFLDKTYNVTEPVAMIRSHWHSNPHFRGTYSYRSIESYRRKVYPRMLEEPLTIDKPRVLFAGEATSEERFSTVDGAIGSGWKAADRLIQYYQTLGTSV